MTKDGEVRRYQVIDVSDFRMPGGTSHSIAEEVRVQSESGISTGLVHVNSDIMKRPLPWSAAMRDTASLPNVDVLTPSDVAHAEALIIRHPSTVKDVTRLLPSLTCEKLIVVANHAVSDSDGSMNYDPAEITRSLRDRFNVEPEWRPIGPVVRETLSPYTEELSIGATWLNIFSTNAMPTGRTSVHTPPTIGRHSRPQPAKWPDRAADIRGAYPLDKQYDVRILGGTAAAESVLHKRPSNWTVYEFGSRPPFEYLSEIDFWVYFHHPRTLEAYGRAVMEALYSGCVVVLPEYMRQSFGEAAIYARPGQVRDLVAKYSSNLDLFLTQSAKGQDFALNMGPRLHTERLRELGANTPQRIEPQDNSALKAPPRSPTKKPRVLFLTSNGAGMGHLTRTLAVARALGTERADSIFFSLSQGVPVVQEQGFAFEYMGSSGAMHMAAAEWNQYFTERLEAILARTQPDAIVFDGTVPYTGLIHVLDELAITRIWIRRGMWRANSPAKSLARERYFDLVIEPGEYATSYDQGPTKTNTAAHRVAPITLLRPEELLDRKAARQALGISEQAQTVLLTLGAGNINSIQNLQAAVQTHFNLNFSDWDVYVTKPPIAESTGSSSLNVLKTYPLARIANAFDFAISAAGYNSFHEWTSMRIPTVWVPNRATSIDDQLARAQWAADTGTGTALLDEGTDAELLASDLAQTLAQMVDHEVRGRMRHKMSELIPPDGAVSTAAAILERVAS